MRATIFDSGIEITSLKGNKSKLNNYFQNHRFFLQKLAAVSADFDIYSIPTNEVGICISISYIDAGISDKKRFLTRRAWQAHDAECSHSGQDEAQGHDPALRASIWKTFQVEIAHIY